MNNLIVINLTHSQKFLVYAVSHKESKASVLS